ncbi:MAG: hypothetical protein MUC85_14130 [Anaerolineales bacterium]|jgi:hypothetical protein|nr:hypothetical protein [Anaerolineales bacterium]
MKKVAIYGNSLVASSIGASLQACSDLQVLSVDLAMPEPKRQLCEFQPQIIIFDVAVTRPEEIIGMWEIQPRLLLIGVDIGKGQALVLSGQTTRALTTTDLLQVVETYHDT